VAKAYPNLTTKYKVVSNQKGKFGRNAPFAPGHHIPHPAQVSLEAAMWSIWG
jgi:hypothetical protein